MSTVITQIRTTERGLDGMCYVIRCDNGATLVVDGGMDDGEAELLINFLKESSGTEIPVVDAWFFTHNHADHTFCFMGVCERHAKEIRVKKLIFDFLDRSFYLAAEPRSAAELDRFCADIGLLEGAETVRPRSGDVYRWGDTSVEILYTASDLPVTNGGKGMLVNDTSLVFRVKAAGQSVLFLGDVQEAGDRVMMDKYGESLKSDVCQVAHHGAFSSTSEFYDLVDPSILLWPARQSLFDAFLIIVSADRHILSDLHVRDIYLAGHGTVSLEMPIKPRPEPYLPALPMPERREGIDIVVPRASRAPAPDPSDPVWSEAKTVPAAYDINGFPGPGPRSDSAEAGLLWTEDALYLKLRFNKTVVFDPDHRGSSDSDCIRLYLAERLPEPPALLWKELSGDPAYEPNLKFYAEPKPSGSEKLLNTAPDRCESALFNDEKGFTVLAKLRWNLPHRAGDVICIDLEFNGVGKPGGPREYSLNTAAPRTFPRFSSPLSLDYARLG